jgi:hypothetical protein
LGYGLPKSVKVHAQGVSFVAWTGSLGTMQAKQGQPFGRMKQQRLLALFK